MLKLELDVRRLGGIANRAELKSLGHSRDLVDLMADYGTTIIRVRNGWFALRDTDASVLRGWKEHGRLACISALRHHGIDLPGFDLHGFGQEDSGTLHVALPRNASRLPRESADVVRHWTDTRSLGEQHPGERTAVPVEESIEQAIRCGYSGALCGGLQQLAREGVEPG
jgi:hypothetical protein